MPAHITTTMHDSNDSNNANTNNARTRPHSYSSHSHSHLHPLSQTPRHLHPQPQRPLSTSSLSTTPVVVLAGKKHPSTPPPPPLPLRSSRRPNSVIAHGIRLFDNSPSPSTSLASSIPMPHTTGLTHGATNNPQPSGNTQTSFHQHHNQKQQGHSDRISRKKSQVLDDIDREASNVCEFIEDQLYFMWTAINPISTRRTTYLTIDSYLQYTAFFSDFGPFDMADVFRFCCLMKERLELARSQKKVLCLHTKPDDTKRANAAFALCCYMMLLHDMTPEEAYAPVEYIHPSITSFRDAGCGPVTYTLSILDCLRGLRKGLDRGLLRLDKFNVKEYEHYERVSNGDFNWITPFFIAFAGPKDKMKREELLRHEAIRAAAGRTRLNKSFRSVLSYFSTHNVQCIIRLNDKTYDKAHFTARGIEHVDMIYPDGTCPPWYIVERFFDVCERVAMCQGGVVAVHCMAGLGRTGTLIGAYLMRHFDMTARETIAFLRLMRPGSVVGPQQNWLAENEWRIRKRDYQHPQSQQLYNGQSVQSVQEERQKEIHGRLLKIQQSHGLTPESTKSSTTVTPAGSTIHTPGTNYEQVFSRANSEGLESTWSEVADEVEGGSLTVLEDDDEEEDEAETSGFEDMTTTEDESMEESNMTEDTDEDEEGGEYGLDWDRTYHPSSLLRPSPLRAQHSRQVSIGSLDSLMSTFERDSVTNDNQDVCDGDVDMGGANTAGAAVTVTPKDEHPSLLKEHIGNTDYVIPGQPRKQDLSSLRHHHHHHEQHHHHSRQASGSSASSQVLSDATTHRTHSVQHEHHHHDDNIRTTGGEGKVYVKDRFLSPFDSSSSFAAATPSVAMSTLFPSSVSASYSALQESSLEKECGSDDQGHFGQGPSSDGGSAEIGVFALAHVSGSGGSATSTGGRQGLAAGETTTKAVITTRTGNAQGTSHHDRASRLSPSPTVEGTNDDAPGPSEFEIGENASQPPATALPNSLLVEPFADNDKAEGVDNHQSHTQPQQQNQRRELGQDRRHSSSAYRREGKQDGLGEEEDRRPFMAQLPHPLPQNHLSNTGHHHYHIHHKQHQHEVPNSPPSLNSPGGGGGEGGASDEVEEGGKGSGGGRTELSQETRAGSVEMCR
ncbi:dual specificity protein phosphatase [Linnemannia elongata]|nr:dual specificity protein phosphatase [Linnemannia elongata]